MIEELPPQEVSRAFGGDVPAHQQQQQQQQQERQEQQQQQQVAFSPTELNLNPVTSNHA
jgi:hypothetical protein